MMKYWPKKTITVLLAVLGFTTVLFLLSGSQFDYQAAMPSYFIANQYYKSGNFPAALAEFFKALKDNPGLVYKEPLVRFKIGYGLYKTGEFSKSIDVLETGKPTLLEIEDYLLYFQALSHLNLQDTLALEARLAELRLKYPESPLLPMADSIQARLSFYKNQLDSTLRYLQAMRASGYFDQDAISLQMIRIYQMRSDTTRFRELSFQFINQFPFHHRASSVFQELVNSYPAKIDMPDLKKIFSYLFTTDQFLGALEFMDRQKIHTQSPAEQEYFQWLPVDIQFRQGEFSQVVDWCLANRNAFKSPAILREINLYIPRCYIRLGNVNQSIKYYLEFQEKYPRDAISPEVLWKVGWLYEEKNNLKSAIAMYQKLVRTYPRNSFFDEAYFRIGLGYYQLKNYKNARHAWEEAVRKVKDPSQIDRIRYWIGKSYEMEKEYQQQGEILMELSQRPIDSFYNLKAFYLTSNGKEDHHRIQEVFWELHQQNQSFLPEYLPRFRRAMLVEEILGPGWGDRELRSATGSSSAWQEVYALGELYEKMQNYGFAYRRFRRVFDQTFAKSRFDQMIPVFKKLYPMYYSHHVDSAVARFSVPPELIWSVMKKESAFEPRVISYANAYGLMQLLPGTASQIAPRLGISFVSTEQLFDPATNINMGTLYLSQLLQRYEGNYIMALAGYNAGPHRVDRWKKAYPTHDLDLFMENIEFEQTRVYVRTCMKFFWVYRAIISPGEIPQEIVNYPVKITDFM